MSEADAHMYAAAAEPPFALTPPKPQDLGPMPSPFLSESAHVRSLQHPCPYRELTYCDGPQLSESSEDRDDVSGHASSPDTVIRLPPAPNSSARQIISRAKRGLECRLGLRGRKEV